MYFYVFLCKFMHMTSLKPSVFARTLDNFRRRKGMTQKELARRLSVSQPHISRILSGEVPPGDKLRLRASRLLSGQSASMQHSEWSEKIVAAADRSPAFRRLVAAALDLTKKSGT